MGYAYLVRRPEPATSMLNCPNCGAPIVGDKCEYCGTVFYGIQRDIYTLQMDTKALASAMHTTELYERAIKAMRTYAFDDI